MTREERPAAEGSTSLDETARQHLVTVDPQAKFAISKFDEAEKLLELSRTKTAAKVAQ